VFCAKATEMTNNAAVDDTFDVRVFLLKTPPRDDDANIILDQLLVV